MKKKLLAAVLALCSLSAAFPAYGAGWQKDPSGYRWQREDGTFVTNEWAWLDGNQDNIAECYYFDQYGYMMRNTATPDGHQVNPDGSWIVKGVVQSRNVGELADDDAQADRIGVISEAGYANEWLGYRVELPAPAHFTYKEKSRELLEIHIRPLGEGQAAATVDMGFQKKEEGKQLADYVAYYETAGNSSGLEEVKKEEGIVLGDGNTYTKIMHTSAESLNDYWIRVSGDYLVLFKASYTEEHSGAIDDVMAAIKPY